MRQLVNDTIKKTQDRHPRVIGIFSKARNYTIQELIDISNNNGLVTVDCLKDEKMISIEREGEDALFEFHKIDGDLYRLTWFENG